MTRPLDSDVSFARLHAAGWSVGEVRVLPAPGRPHFKRAIGAFLSATLALVLFAAVSLLGQRPEGHAAFHRQRYPSC